MSRTALCLLLAVLGSGCAAARASAPSMAALSFDAMPASPPPLTENHFARDRTALGEAELKEILAAPVFLEEGARVGVVPVASKYELDDDVPVEAAPAVLADAMEGSGLFELSSEVSTEWPTERGLPGLRELAARYRAEYLVLYRHRFNDAVSANALAIAYATVIGLALPGTTIDTAGVLEATLYDVKTGTILFTVNERVHARESTSALSVDERKRQLHERLVAQAAPKLADQVLGRCRHLAAARPKTSGPDAPKQALAVEPQGEDLRSN